MATKKTNAAEAEGRASTVDTPKTPELLEINELKKKYNVGAAVLRACVLQTTGNPADRSPTATSRGRLTPSSLLRQMERGIKDNAERCSS